LELVALDGQIEANLAIWALELRRLRDESPKTDQFRSHVSHGFFSQGRKP
jgi:hypothetical protein